MLCDLGREFLGFTEVAPLYPASVTARSWPPMNFSESFPGKHPRS